MKNLSEHIVNLNQALKRVKSDTMVNFICSDHCGLIITFTKIKSQLNLDVVDKYVKNINLVDSNNVKNACLFQSKSYLKILGILYFIEGTNAPMDFSVIETVIKSMYIFNNIHIASKP